MACLPTKDIEMLSWRDELVQPFEGTALTGQSYYLLYRRDSVRIREVEALCGWVMKTMGAESQPRPLSGDGERPTLRWDHTAPGGHE